MENYLVDHIQNGDYAKTKEIIEGKLNTLKETFLSIYKQELAHHIYSDPEELSEKARWRIVRVRIRKGKIQRRKYVSNIKGYTFRGPKGHRKLVRMPPRERMKRRLSQRRAKIKRKAKRSRIRVKRRRSMMKRHSLGLK